MADYPKLREWAERALDQGDGVALYQLAAQEAIELLKDKATWDSTARFLLKKLEEAEAAAQWPSHGDLEWRNKWGPGVYRAPDGSPTHTPPPGADLATEQSLKGYYRVDI